jgi:hypothetical protein
MRGKRRREENRREKRGEGKEEKGIGEERG